MTTTPVNFDTEARTRLLADMTLDINPTGTTIAIKIDTVWHPAEWLDQPVVQGNRWAQTARTTGTFVGPAAANQASATQLTAGTHTTKTKVVSGTDELVEDANPILVE